MLSGRRRSGGAGPRGTETALWYDPATLEPHEAPHVQLFTIFFSRPVEFGLATGLTVLMLAILVRSMFSSEGSTSLSRFVTGPSSRIPVAALFIGWAVVFRIGLQLVPHRAGESP